MTAATLTRTETHPASSYDPASPSPSADPIPRAAQTVADTDDHVAAMDDLVDTWGMDSFPASDPPANW
jgi:hypothetical protein